MKALVLEVKMGSNRKPLFCCGATKGKKALKVDSKKDVKTLKMSKVCEELMWLRAVLGLQWWGGGSRVQVEEGRTGQVCVVLGWWHCAVLCSL